MIYFYIGGVNIKKCRKIDSLPTTGTWTRLALWNTKVKQRQKDFQRPNKCQQTMKNKYHTIVFFTNCIYSDYLKAIITFGVFNRWGTTPLDEAKKKGDKEIIDILQS